MGLALLHGYVTQDQLTAAADEDSEPSAILTSLRTAGILDEPCLHGLEQSLNGMPAVQGETAATQAISNKPGSARTRELQLPDQDPGSAASSDLFSQLSLATWNRYQNLRFIGEGGMGRIFKALDPDLNRTVALKFLRGQDPVQLSRFLFEAQAQALVDHPNICKVYEVSQWLGHHYIAMQYVNGPSLGKLAPELRLTDLLGIMQTVAEAVHAAHRRGLIHRDIKPSNIQVEMDEDGTCRPFVLDFGLARSQDSAGLTVSGLVVGTTAYMAPEQARGETHQIDRRTDVYGLGATLYKIFTGAPPFGAAVGVDCLRMVLEVEPQPLRKIAPDLPADLETIVMKCLEKEPARRYDNALMLAEDLRRLREGEPIQARPATLAYRASRFAKKNRALAAISALAFLGLLAFGGAALNANINSNIRAAHAQHFGQEAERIEALLRYARLLPQQNIEPHLAAVRQRLTNLESEVRSAGRLAMGPGEYAIGRSL
ncbi:MAG: serine/threonine protein kinase, partial [Acidobacteriota bacterium]|nr:serine/threonine protein kinase [Acidobacteriota bacterium]